MDGLQHFKRLYTEDKIVIAACDGSRRFVSRHELTNAVKTHCDFSYKSNEQGCQIPSIDVTVYQSQGSSQRALFDLFKSQLNDLSFSQSQIIEFCRNFPGWLAEGSTIFLLKEEKLFYVVFVESRRVEGEYDGFWGMNPSAIEPQAVTFYKLEGIETNCVEMDTGNWHIIIPVLQPQD